MTEPVLYHEYGWEDAVARFGSIQHARIHCEGQWVIFPQAILCLTTLGEPPMMPHFQAASRFWWVTDKPPIPEEVIAGRNRHPIIHIFARNAPRQKFMYLGKLGPSHQQSYPRSGEYAAAEFDLRPALPSQIWHNLGGFDPGDLNHARIDASLQQLHGKTTTQGRLEILRKVAKYWHGSIALENGIREEELAGKDMPFPLRRWYRMAGRRREIMSGQNLLLEPGQLKMEDGLLLFYSENQWCYEWATQPTGDDPPVYGREDQSKPWASEGMSLSGFLIQVCLFEAVICHARYGASASWIDADVMEEIAKTIRPIPIGPWGWGRTQFWAGNGAFACVADNGEHEGRQGYSIWIGAKTEHPLEFMKPIVTDEWEFLSL